MSNSACGTSTVRRARSFGPALTCLSAIFIGGCATTRCPDPEPPRIVYVKPSAALLLPTPDPGLVPVVVADYVDYSYACEAALAKCNADKAGVRKEVE
jgi:hypothetical protein